MPSPTAETTAQSGSTHRSSTSPVSRSSRNSSDSTDLQLAAASLGTTRQTEASLPPCVTRITRTRRRCRAASARAVISVASSPARAAS